MNSPSGERPSEDPGLPFEDLRIIALARDRCCLIEGSLPRIFFQLSRPAPLGWAYLFTGAWQANRYPGRARAWVEDDVVWIECNPEEVRPVHLAQLEKVVAQANANFRNVLEQRFQNKSRRSRLDATTEALLDELDRSFEPAPDSKPRKRLGSWPPRIAAALSRAIRSGQHRR